MLSQESPDEELTRTPVARPFFIQISFTCQMCCGHSAK